MFEVAIIVPDDALQFNPMGGPPVRLGGVVLLVTITVSVLVQPESGSVTVTTYVPAAPTVGLVVVAPETIFGPAQLYVTLGVTDDAEICPLVLVQLSANAAPAETCAPIT